jgi:hypothetical protein
MNFIKKLDYRIYKKCPHGVKLGDYYPSFYAGFVKTLKCPKCDTEWKYEKFETEWEQ